MKAAVSSRYGTVDVVSVADVPTPAPKGEEILVRVHAATVGAVDSLARQGSPRYARAAFGLRRPKHPVLGSDFAGQVEAVGPAVTRFAAGDQVFGTVAPRTSGPGRPSRSTARPGRWAAPPFSSPSTSGPP